MPKNENKKQKNGKKGKLKLVKIIAPLSAAIICFSLLVVPSFALGTGVDEISEREMFAPVNDLYLTEYYSQYRSGTEVGRIRYVNNINLPLFDENITAGQTSIQYSLNGVRESLRTVFYNYTSTGEDTARVSYDRVLTSRLNELGGIGREQYEYHNPTFVYYIPNSYYYGSDEFTVGMYLDSSTYQFSTDTSHPDSVYVGIYYYALLETDVGAQWVYHSDGIRASLTPVSSISGNSVFLVSFDIKDYFSNYTSVPIRDLTVFFESPIRTYNDGSYDYMSYDDYVSNGVYVSGFYVSQDYSRAVRHSVTEISVPTYISDSFNPLSWVVGVVDEILNLPLFTTASGQSVITISVILGIVVTLLFAVTVLKFFYGG